jgi:hypothetical protein
VTAPKKLGQDDVAGLQCGDDLPKQDRFAGRFALAGSWRRFVHRPHGHAQDRSCGQLGMLDRIPARPLILRSK